MWRLGDDEEIVGVGPGTSAATPTGTRFRFRSDSDEPLSVIGATMSPWRAKASLRRRRAVTGDGVAHPGGQGAPAGGGAPSDAAALFRRRPRRLGH